MTPGLRRTSIRLLLLYAAMALSGGVLVSGLILWVDIYELFRGAMDAQLCELQQRDADTRFVGDDTGCSIRFSYIGLALLYGPVAVTFWLLVVGGPALGIRIISLRASGAAVPADGKLIRETMAIYVLAVIFLAFVGAAHPAWYFGAFSEPVWPFLLAPPLLFAPALYLWRRRREPKPA